MQPLLVSRVLALDGIRGTAVLMVVASHSVALLQGGVIGVDLFFVLSGFLITSLLLQEHTATGSIDIGRFYLRRALRLLPAIFPVLILVIGYAAVRQSPEMLTATLSDARSIIFYYFNWELALSHEHYYAHHQPILMHFWSLSVEEQFYLVWPVLLTGLLWLRVPTAILLALFVAGIVLPAGARLALYEKGQYWLNFRTDLRIDDLVWGAFAAWAIYAGWLVPRGWPARVLPWAGLAAGVVLLSIATQEIFHNGYLMRGLLSVVAFLSALVIVVAARCPPAPLRHALELAPLRFTGRISYALYLWHLPALVIVHNEFPAGGWPYTLGAIAASFAAATISYYALERPFLRLKDRIGYLPIDRPAVHRPMIIAPSQHDSYSRSISLRGAVIPSTVITHEQDEQACHAAERLVGSATARQPSEAGGPAT
jgi:peptidoglycan/LPS O-acetylase OafA/YrhL